MVVKSIVEEMGSDSRFNVLNMLDGAAILALQNMTQSFASRIQRLNAPSVLSEVAATAFQNLTKAIITRLQSPLPVASIYGVQMDVHYIVEAFLVVIIGILIMAKSHKPKKKPLTQQEIDQLCDEWVPEPLHPPLTSEQKSLHVPVLSSAAGPRTKADGKDVLNLTSTNFLGLVGHPKIQEACDVALRKYGVGACGPRGFYGTIDVHLDLEERISKFLGTEDTILYSYGLATVSSAVPAYCKRGDLLIADEGVNWSIQNGLLLSRSTVKWFKHNDMADLEARLKEVQAEDRRGKRKALNRRFIIVEGIYQNTGEMVPLDAVMALKDTYCFRVLVDESLSIGVLGKSGRGITEHFGIPIQKVDILTAGLGNAVGSVGGFCSGSARMVDHQRLSGAGYCFSASLPPFLATASIAAIDVIAKTPRLLSDLHSNSSTFRKAVQKIRDIVVVGHPKSALLHLQLKCSTGSFASDTAVLQKIVNLMLEHDSVMATVAKRAPLDRCNLPASIRVAISSGHTKSDLLAAATALKNAVQAVLH